VVKHNEIEEANTMPGKKTKPDPKNGNKMNHSDRRKQRRTYVEPSETEKARFANSYHGRHGIQQQRY